MGRRVKVFQTDKASKSRIPLIERKDGCWQGALAKELPAIYKKYLTFQTIQWVST